MLSQNCRKSIHAAATFAQALVLCLLPSHPAEALNGFTYLGVCACTTTADFLAGAEQIALAQHPDTGTNIAPYVFATFATYTMLSTSTARTAYVQVNGQLTYHANQRPIIVTYQSSAAIPVDSAGNSIAAETESQQESFYTALDGNLWGVNREEPLEVECPDAYESSFIGSYDEEVGPGIDQALLAKGINWATELPVGALVLVKFSDGTSAVFIKANNTTDHWAWAGVAHDKNGNLINRAGQLLINPNTSGTGGGSGDTNTGGYNFLITGDPACYASTQVTTPDGTVIDGGSWGPC